MSPSERARHDLRVALERVLGERDAATLMEHLPPEPRSELVTRDDLRVTAAELRAEIAELRAEMAELRAELRAEMGELRGEMQPEISGLRGEVERRLAEQTRSLVTAMVATNLTAVFTAAGLAFAAAQLA